MSWGVVAIGKPAAVAAKLAADFASCAKSCSNFPAEEQSVKDCAAVVAGLLGAMIGPVAVSVRANGSASVCRDRAGVVTSATYGADLKVETLYGFVE